VTLQAQIIDLLREQQERLDMEIRLISHDLRAVTELTDEIAVMHAGTVVEHAAVLSAPDARGSTNAICCEPGPCA